MLKKIVFSFLALNILILGFALVLIPSSVTAQAQSENEQETTIESSGENTQTLEEKQNDVGSAIEGDGVRRFENETATLFGEQGNCRTEKIDYRNLFILTRNIPIIPDNCAYSFENPEDPDINPGPQPLSLGYLGDILIRLYSFFLSLAFNTIGVGAAVAGVYIMIQSITGAESSGASNFLKKNLPKMLAGLVMVLFAYIVPITFFSFFGIEIVENIECLFTTPGQENPTCERDTISTFTVCDEDGTNCREITNTADASYIVCDEKGENCEERTVSTDPDSKPQSNTTE